MHAKHTKKKWLQQVPLAPDIVVVQLQLNPVIRRAALSFIDPDSNMNFWCIC